MQSMDKQVTGTKIFQGLNSGWLRCLLVNLFISLSLFQKTCLSQTITSTLVTSKQFATAATIKFIAPHTADGRLNFATTTNAFSQSDSSSARFSSVVDQIKVAEEQGRVVYKSQDGVTFAVDSGFVYLDLNQIRDVSNILFAFGNYVLYAPNSAPAGSYRILNVKTGVVTSLTTPTQDFFQTYSCGDGNGQLVCLTVRSTEGQILNMDTASFKAVDFQMILDYTTGRKVNYSKIWKVAGFENFIVVVAERQPAGQLLTVDGYYLASDNSLILVQTVTLTLTEFTYRCQTASQTPVVDLNIVEGILGVSCAGIPGNTTIYTASQNVWAPATIDGVVAAEVTGLYFNKFSSQATISSKKADNSATLSLLTLSTGASAQKANETLACRVYSKLYRQCTACNPGFLLTFDNTTTTTRCSLNEPFVAGSAFSVFTRKGFLFVTVNTLPRNESPDSLKKRLSGLLSNNGGNLVFYDADIGRQIPTSSLFDLELQLNEYDLKNLTLRYKMTTQQERGAMILSVRLKIKDPSSLGASASTAAVNSTETLVKSRRLQFSSTVAPSTALPDSQLLELNSRSGPSADLEVLCLSLYIILCVPCQVFLIFVRPFHQDMRESFKTFWVSSLVIHLQTLCLLGTLGGDLRGPLDNLFGAALKAMMKYLVFDLEFNFDSKVAEYQLVSPYDGLAYNNVNPYILQTRFLWIALYIVAYIFSVIGTRRFKTKFYHMRIGVIMSTLPELIYFSITTMYSIGFVDNYNTFTSFSLVIAIITLIVVFLEFLYIQLCSFKNLKFMLMFDTSRNLVDEYKFATVEFLRLHTDFFFAVLASGAMAFISQKVEVLGRLFIGLGVVYILLNISRLTTNKPDFHKISHKLKLVYGGLWNLLMICTIEVYSNLAFGRLGINGLSYFSMVIVLLMLITIATIVVYRVFSPETPGANDKPEATYKTNYVLRTYKRAKGKEGTAVPTNPNATTILVDETFLSRTAAKQGVEASGMRGQAPSSSSALPSMRKTTSKQKDGPTNTSTQSPMLRNSSSGYGNTGAFRLAELASVPSYSHAGSRQASERAGRGDKPSGSLLDKFSSGMPPEEPRDNSRGRKVNPTSNAGSLGGSAKNSARGNGYSFRAGLPEEDPSIKDASPGRHLDQIFNRGLAQDRRAELAKESNPGVSGWMVSDPKASLNNLYQIKESRIEEASQLGDLSYDINLAINDPNPNLMRKKSLRELMNEDSDKKNPEKSDSPKALTGLGVGLEGHPNRATYAENLSLSAKTSQITRPTHLQAVGIQDLEIPPEN